MITFSRRRIGSRNPYLKILWETWNETYGRKFVWFSHWEETDMRKRFKS